MLANYADNRFGAASCTGRSKQAIHTAQAYSVVRSLRDGMALEVAVRVALRQVNDLDDSFDVQANTMNIIAMDRHGNMSAVSHAPNWQYVYQHTDMDAYEVRERLYLLYAAE